MGKVIDLGTIVKEDLVFKSPNGDEIRIPGQVSLDFVLKLHAMQERLDKTNDMEEQFVIMKEMILEILKLNTTVKVDMDYINTHLNDINIMKVIIQSTVEHISEVASDKNL